MGKKLCLGAYNMNEIKLLFISLGMMRNMAQQRAGFIGIAWHRLSTDGDAMLATL